jgi:long-chain fatty acid transport protein
MSMKRNLTLAFAVFAAVAAPSAFATNGYFSHGYSLKEKALAGAGVAMPQDAMASSTNPAGVVMVGQRMDLGAVWFRPERSYSVDANGGFWGMGGGIPESVDSDKNDFLIPNFGAVWVLDPNSALGLAVYGNGGMNTTYPGSAQRGAGTFFGGAFSGNAHAGVDLSQVFTNLSYARKINETSSWGASAIIAYQRFKATGLSAFANFSNDRTHLTDNGYDSSTGYGAKLGWTGEVSQGLSLGASYQTKISMGEFDKYKGLFAENGGFDIPSTWTVGLAYQTTKSSTLLLDVQRINYTDVKSVSNRETNLTGCMGGDTSQCLGGSEGAGFGWKDMTVVKLGYQWETNPAHTWRVGYSKTKQPIRDDELMFNILVPAVVEQHFTFGFTNKMSKNNELTLSAMYAPEKKVSGTDAVMGENIQIKMTEYEIGVNYGWKF